MIGFKKIPGYLVVVCFLTAFLLSGSSCSMTKKTKDIYERTPADLLAEGQAKLDKAEFKSATKLLQAIKDRYPYSKESMIAELKLADSLFQRGEYDEALEDYSEFERLHPKDKDIPYVVYQRGLCHFNQIESMDREQSQVAMAREEFEGLVKRFPVNEYSLKAREKIRQCLVYQAEYELYVGIFYYRTKRYQPAITRFTYLIENYPDVGQYQEALEYIAKCRGKLAEAERQEGPAE